MIKNIALSKIRGEGEDSHKGEFFDTVGYEQALKDTGYTNQEAQEYWRYNSDPIVSGVQGVVKAQTPKVVINDDTVQIVAPQSFFDSPASSQLKTELQVLKGADLKNNEVINAIDKLNKEIETNYSNALIEQSLGWTPEEYKDYQYTLQTSSVSNPMQSPNPVKGREKDGKIEVKTPKEWTEYYKTAYSADERTDALYNSARSADPYERTMALLLMHGSNNPVYGFTSKERMKQTAKAAWNQLKKFPEGTFRLLASDNDTKRIESLNKTLKIPENAFDDFSINTDDKFEQMKQAIEGKTWRELTDKEKAFVLEAGVSKENKGLNASQRVATEKLKNPSGEEVLSRLASESDTVSRDAIRQALTGSDFERYKEVRNNYDTWRNYDRETNRDDERLAKNAIWSSFSQQAGNIGGTIGRYLWENAVIQGLTGGISPESLATPKLTAGAAGGLSMNAISEQLGDNLITLLASKGISPASSGGQQALRFAANLIGTIPEDIIQTSMDNILTYNAEENANLLKPSEISDNFKRNLIFMALFNIAKTGIGSVRKARIAKNLARKADLEAPINIEGLNADADDLARAITREGGVEIEDGRVSIIDENGEKKVLDNVTPEQVELARRGAQTAEETEAPAGVVREAIEDSAEELEAAKPKEGTTETVKVEVETPDGRTLADAPDYRPTSLEDALEIKVENTPAAIRNWHNKTLNVVMDSFKTHLDDFRNRFRDVRVSDFDWVWWNTKQGLTPEQIVGTTDPTTGRTVTQNMIDAMQWWSEQPFTKDLRKASRGALGLEGDFDTLGYLPHTVYDPTNLSLEEAITGRLWETSSGASVTDAEGNYRGFGGDFADRYRTFASNMLWDSQADAVATAKMIEEAQMDGRELTPELVEQSQRAVEGMKKIQEDVDNATSTKDLNEALSSDSGADETDWKKIDKAIEEQAPKSGLGQAIHDNRGEIYIGADTHDVVRQLSSSGAAFDTMGDSMRKIQVEGVGNMYDAGAADMVYGRQNAIELTNRLVSEGGDYARLREMLTEYIVSHSKRTQKYAENIADKWIGRLSETPGPLTKAKMIKVFGNAMTWEGQTRLNRWLALANYSQFNVQTRKFIDNFLFRHMQMSSVKSNQTINQKLVKFMNSLTGYRYRALFYGNIKNALLQLSELNRLWTTFKWGDVGKMLKRLATDENFRARVDTYVDAVVPMTDQLRAELYGEYSNVADNMKVTKDGVTFRNMGEKAKDAADKIGLAPINAAENLKNRTIVAALVQEADSLGLSGDEALRHIRNRFERVALAQNEMGRIGLAANPLAKPMLFLQNFQIRELGMHYYNIKDLTGMEKSVPKRVLNGFKYGSKVLGTKFATALILARLGYSATQAMGLDPFGLLDNYTPLDEEDMEWQDYFFKSPLFAGGMTSLISDLYFMGRKAFEESTKQTVSDKADQKLGASWGIKLPEGLFSYDSLMGGVSNFVPGNTLAKRISQMNELMDTGWGVSSTGNKMYTAPTDTLNTVLGYLFGRSATENAQRYNQNYGENLTQTLGRFNPFREYREFDPIDTKNYTDWFKGDGNDLQQFNLGLRYFRTERDKIIDTYEEAIRDSYASSEDIAEAKNNMDNKLEELFDQLERFVTAYERRNGTITPAMVKRVVDVLDTGRATLSDTEAEASDRDMQDYSDALRRYSELGLSPVGTYSGPTTMEPEKETKYQGSPQFRTAVSGYYNVGNEAVSVLKLADEQLAPIRESLQQDLSNAYAISDWDTIKDIQKEYLRSFDQVVSPIIALYGNSILTNTNVEDQLRDMLSTGSNRRSGNLIPSEQYSKNKYGRYQSMPYQNVDVSAWAKQRFRSDVYKKPTSRSDSTVEEDIKEIKRLEGNGNLDRARARALQLKARVDNHVRTLKKSDYEWLNNFLKQGGK